MQKGILYAPDFVINAGGLINVADELQGYNKERAYKKIEMIYTNIKKLLAISKERQIPTNIAANLMAEERMEKLGRIRNIYLNK